MENDYYEILGVDRSASHVDVKKSYRKLSLKWHPERNEGNPIEARKKFQEAAEAYEVLSKPKTRAIFDKFGEQGLKQGVPDGKGGFQGAWRLKETAEEVFLRFFGSSNAFAEVFGDKSSSDAIHGHMLGVVLRQKEPKQRKESLCVTLEDLYQGCTKRVSLQARRLYPGSTKTVDEKITLVVGICKGWSHNTSILYKKAGDHELNCPPADIVIQLLQLPHPRFVREGNDLIYTHEIDIVDALCGSTVAIRTLDDRVLTIPLSDIVTSATEKVVASEGMPLLGKRGKFGDLKIRFKLRLPDQITQAQKKQIRQIFPKS